MSAAPPPSSFDPVRWFSHQPYLLLGLASLFWAGNIVLGRHVAGHVPPMTLSCIRWIGACLMLLPFAWPHLKRDWPVLRGRLPLMIQSSGPLFIALWALILFGVRLTWAQVAGIALSLLGVLTIILRGDFAALTAIHFNIGDLMMTGALIAFGLYSALMLRRPVTHQLSLICFTTACGALLLLPLSIWEFANGVTLKFDAITLITLVYVVIFPSTLAYLFFNRGIAAIGPNRAAPFFHLVPVFGSVMAIVLLGEQPQLFHFAGYLMVLGGVVIASRKAPTT
jgi:drug/metabolite transporter (DMT)-like permease